MQYIRQLLSYMFYALAGKVTNSSRQVEENAVGGLDQDPVDGTAATPTGVTRSCTHSPAAAATDRAQANKSLRQQAFPRLWRLIGEPPDFRLGMPGGDASALGTDRQVHARRALAGKHLGDRVLDDFMRRRTTGNIVIDCDATVDWNRAGLQDRQVLWGKILSIRLSQQIRRREGRTQTGNTAKGGTRAESDERFRLSSDLAKLFDILGVSYASLDQRQVARADGLGIHEDWPKGERIVGKSCEQVRAQ